MCDRDRKITKINFGRKRESTGYIYLPGSKYHESEVHLNLRSCLQYSVINYTPRVGEYINKHELYRQYPARIVKDTKMTEIENTLCVITVMNVTPFL